MLGKEKSHEEEMKLLLFLFQGIFYFVSFLIISLFEVVWKLRFPVENTDNALPVPPKEVGCGVKCHNYLAEINLLTTFGGGGEIWN